jgi:hypothetical protein
MSSSIKQWPVKGLCGRFSLVNIFRSWRLSMHNRRQDLLTFLVVPLFHKQSANQGLKRRRLSWLTNSVLVYEPKPGGEGELRGLSKWVQLYTGAQINLTYGAKCTCVREYTVNVYTGESVRCPWEISVPVSSPHVNPPCYCTCLLENTVNVYTGESVRCPWERPVPVSSPHVNPHCYRVHQCNAPQGHHPGLFLFLPLYIDLCLSSSVLKGTVVRDGFLTHCILSRIEKKDLKFFSCCANIYWVRARFNSFCAQGEYAEWYFPVGQAKNCNFILFS